MPDVKIYIRAEDLEKWNSIPHKSEFISVAINNGVVNKKFVAEREQAAKDNTPIEIPNKVAEVFNVELCEHGAGRKLCKKKGCKFYQFK